MWTTEFLGASFHDLSETHQVLDAVSVDRLRMHTYANGSRSGSGRAWCAITTLDIFLDEASTPPAHGQAPVGDAHDRNFQRE